MSEYTISQVCPTDRTALAQIDALLQQESGGIYTFRCYFPCRDHGTHSDFRCSVRDGLLKNIVSDAILYH